MTLLRGMTGFLAAQPNFTLLYDSDIEVVTPQLQKIQFASSGTIVVSRPNKIHATRVGGYADLELFFDGQSAVLYGRNLDAYAKLDPPGSLDDLIHRLRNDYGVNAPGADLLLTQSFEEMTTDIIDAKYIGRGVVDGVECEHLAFRGLDVDWQVWIAVGARPVPHKYVITSKTITGAPQYTLRISGFKTDARPAPEEFSFKAPASAKSVDLNQLSVLDELPAGVPEVASR